VPRPKRSPKEAWTQVIQARVTKEIMRQVDTLCEHKGLSTSAWLRGLILKELEHEKEST
jgi:hypothetical protein